jgi:hypothetical protein
MGFSKRMDTHLPFFSEVRGYALLRPSRGRGALNPPNVVECRRVR